MNVIKAIFAFGDHRWCVTPNTHLPILADFMNSRFETSNSLVVVFQEENRLHPNVPLLPNAVKLAHLAGKGKPKSRIE